MENADDRTILETFTEEFVQVLDKYTRYIIVSGFVAILHGRSRGTEDIDIVIERLQPEKFALLHKDLIKSDFECLQGSAPKEIHDYLKSGLSVRYIKKGTYLPQMEMKFAKDHIDDFQMATRKKLPLTGTDFFFPSIESAIAFKEELLKSKKDMKDAQHLRLIYGQALDNSEIERWKKEIKKARL